MLARFFLAVAAMVAIVAASNVLVQFPVQGQVAGLDLSQLLTGGAFTYPAAFLVTDLSNRHRGPARARLVVLVGFGIAVLCSIFLATPRIAIASGSAFLISQLLDISVFDRLRRSAWWHAPLFSSLVSSALDTLLFFGLAFAASFAFLDTGAGLADGSLPFPTPLLGVGFDVPLWVSLGAGDFLVKLLMALLLLAPYRALRGLWTSQAVAGAA